MATFDIVSKIDLQEVDNAINSVLREIGNRYDFKGVKYSIENDKDKNQLTIVAESNYALEQIQGSLKVHITRRDMDAKALDFITPEKASGGSLRQVVKIKQGIDQDVAKKIIKEIKATKMKVQAAIRGDELRITGKKRDDLQEAMALVKDMKLDLPVQFVNFRD